MIRHPRDVSAACGIGLRHHPAAISVDAHTDDVRDHDPVICIDEDLGHPIQEFLRIDTGKESEVRQDHQPRDVMDPCALLDRGDDVIDAGHLRPFRFMEERE